MATYPSTFFVEARGSGAIGHRTGCCGIPTGPCPPMGPTPCIDQPYCCAWKLDLVGLIVGPIGIIGKGMGHPGGHYHPSSNCQFA